MWGAQKADESFETLSVVALLHIALQSRTVVCTLHALLATLGIWLIPAIFCEVHLFVTVAAAAATLARSLRGEDTRDQRHYVRMATAAALVGFAAWILDFAFCDTFGSILLHAYCWHPLTALALMWAGRAAAITFSPAAVDEVSGKGKRA